MPKKKRQNKAKEVEISGKEHVIAIIAQKIEEITGVKRGRLSRHLFNTAVAAIFEVAVTEGYFRLPSGLGALKVEQLKTADTLVLSVGKTLKKMLEAAQCDCCGK